MIATVTLAGMEGQSWLTIILVNAIAIMISAGLLDGVEIKSFIKAIVVAIVLSILNATVGAFLKVLSFPLNVISFGLFTFVVNAFILKLTANLISGFEIRSFGRAFLLALILAIVNGVLFSFI